MNKIISVIFLLLFGQGLQAQSSGFETIKNLELMDQVFEHLDLYFVDEPSPAKMAKKGIDAMLKELDPYTVFIHESNIEDYRLMTTGEYGGIGALIRKIDEYVYITEPYEDNPAFEAGLKAGDRILRIEGIDMKNKSSEEVSSALKGPKGSKIEVEIERFGGDKKKISVQRDEIKLKDVPFSGMIDSSIGYIKLNSFTPTASSEVEKAMKALREEGMKQLVFDLRGNGGGLLMEAVKIVNFFVPRNQLVVSTKGRMKEESQEFKTQIDPIEPDLPLTVLIDENSASASEIVAGSLQDLDRAVIVGQTSFGKGLVQRTYNLEYGSKIKITIAKYYTPSGRCVQRLEYYDKKEGMKPVEIADSLLQKFKTKNGREVIDGRGIEPDVEVELKNLSTLSLQLMTNASIFKFANEFQSSNTSIEGPKEFDLSDAIYDQFLSFMKGQNFDYRTESFEELKKLEGAVDRDQMSEEMRELLLSAKETLKPSLERDLRKFKIEIKELLENEIISRYYFQKGRAINAFKNDEVLNSAKSILLNPENYKRLLSVIEK